MEKTIDEKLDLILENQKLILEILKPILNQPEINETHDMNSIVFSLKKRE